jgi:hypothetical protein
MSEAILLTARELFVLVVLVVFFLSVVRLVARR